MAKIEMDVTEYDALRNNIKLLEEAKKEQAELHKVIDKLKEDNLQNLRDVQQKVLTQTTVETIEQLIPRPGSIEFDGFVGNIYQFVTSSMRGEVRRDEREVRCPRCGERTSYHNQCHYCGYTFNRSSREYVSMDIPTGSSVREWVTHQVRSFVGTPKRTSTTTKGTPVYVGFEEVKRELESEITQSLDKKTKVLLSMEEEFVASAKERENLNSVITVLQKEKILLAERLTDSKRTVLEKETEIKKLEKGLTTYRTFIFRLNKVVDASYYTVFSLKGEIKKAYCDILSKEEK